MFASDWKPEVNGSGPGGWEPVFHPVDANTFIYVPWASVVRPTKGFYFIALREGRLRAN
jgi:hypothetical protein